MRFSVGLAALGAAMAAFGGAVQAQQLVYTPVNPQFGGSPLNASQLEADAAAQNQYRNAPTTQTQTQAQLFASELQSQLLGDLATQVSQAIFGPNAQPWARSRSAARA